MSGNHFLLASSVANAQRKRGARRGKRAQRQSPSGESTTIYVLSSKACDLLHACRDELGVRRGETDLDATSV